MTLTVIVTGGRDYADRARVCSVLSWLKPGTVMHGDCRTGADRFASEWAESMDVGVIACPADWERHGKAAGPMRNRYMLDTYQRALIVAFQGGRGTGDMVREAVKRNRSVLLIDGGPMAGGEK